MLNDFKLRLDKRLLSLSQLNYQIFNIIELYNIDNYQISTLTVPKYSGLSSRHRQAIITKSDQLKRHEV